MLLWNLRFRNKETDDIVMDVYYKRIQSIEDLELESDNYEITITALSTN